MKKKYCTIFNNSMYVWAFGVLKNLSQSLRVQWKTIYKKYNYKKSGSFRKIRPDASDCLQKLGQIRKNPDGWQPWGLFWCSKTNGRCVIMFSQFTRQLLLIAWPFTYRSACKQVAVPYALLYIIILFEIYLRQILYQLIWNVVL